MDDLNGLVWSATSNTKPNKVSPGTGNYYPSLRPTPSPANSGQNTPLSAQGSGAPKPFAPPKTTAPDSFSNLVSFGSTKTNTLTLQQQQAKLQEEKRRKEEEQRKQYDAQFGNTQFWDGLGNTGKGVAGQSPIPSPIPVMMSQPSPSPFAPTISPPPIVNGVGNSGDDDLFAAFNKDTKVDNSSHYPPPSVSSSRAHTPGFGTASIPDLSNPQAWNQPSSGSGDFDDDDDPFGLGQMKPSTSVPVSISNTADDDDFLGDLGKPVGDVKRPIPAVPELREESSSDDDDFLGDLGKPVGEVKRPIPAVPELRDESSSDDEESNDPWDKAVAELVDMGFTAEQSRRALTESGSGLDLQAAVGWILNDAHAQAKAKVQHKEPSHRNGSASHGERRNVSTDGRKSNPAWMREEGRSQSQQPRRADSRSPNNENDFSKTAAAVGSNIFKTANSFWKTSQKKIEKAVAEFQADADPSQPKWMREAAEREALSEQRARRTKAEAAKSTPDVTDEALALESGSRPPLRKSKAPTSDLGPSRDRSPIAARFPPERSTSNPRWQQIQPQSRPTPPPMDLRVRVNKQAIEEQSAQAYVSPARRKKTTPQPQTQPIREPGPDLLFASSSQSRPASRPAAFRPTPKSTPSTKPSTPIPSRPKAPPRAIPAISPIALKSSTQHRLEGKAHFDRGDYSAAHTSYTSSLSPLPQNHPIIILLLAERAISSVKTGHPREAISDSDRAIEIIGSSRGQDEIIDLSTGAPDDRRPMKEYWGKALTSKAEALEALEKWKDASEVWKLCVEGGVGGATAIQGRQRCDKALAPRPASRPVQKSPPKPSAAVSLSPTPDSDAVLRLRAANQAAEKADDEKLALVDKVEERVNKWREGKRDNLRALIGSMENVLWEGSGWKKVGLHELVINSKVKINYMKAIGKCHPDKLPQYASQEVRMIAALVFSTLNESWDAFKAQNGM
ncbi:auxilin-like clathrin-binding protein required for normal clathrin function [Ciborinia camelliae]|nr:auxilin-like clathrin-binding protein required for normal clathrin function [Ciborinia camelliae]